jgi:hypothetical protein
MQKWHSIRDSVIKDWWQEEKTKWSGMQQWHKGPRHNLAAVHLRKKRAIGSSIRGRSRRQELCLGSVKTLYETLIQTLELEVTKRAIRISSGLRKVSD